MKDKEQIVNECLTKLIAACALEKMKSVVAQNEDKWITIHPNGEENKGRHLLLKDGESVEDAMHRNGWYEKRQAKEDKQEQKQSDKEEKGEEFSEDFKKLADETAELEQKYLENPSTELAKQINKNRNKLLANKKYAELMYRKNIATPDTKDKQPDKEETKDLYSDENFKEYSKRKTQHNFGKEVTHDENGKKGKIIGSVPRGIDPDTNEKLYLYEIKWQDGSVERLSSKKIRVEKSLKDLEKELNEDNFFTQKNKERIEKQKQKKEWSLEDYYKNSIAGDDFAKKWEYAKKHPWRDLTNKANSVGKAGISADEAKEEKGEDKKDGKVIDFSKLKDLKEKVNKFMDQEMKDGDEFIKKVAQMGAELEKEGFYIYENADGFNLKDKDGERLYMKNEKNFEKFIKKLVSDYNFKDEVTKDEPSDKDDKAETVDDKIKKYENKIPKNYRRDKQAKMLWLYKNDYITYSEWNKARENEWKASNSFVDQFKDTLYTALAEGIYNRLGE